MAKKRAMKKKISRRALDKIKSIGSYKRKFEITFKNLIFFIVLFVVSLGLYLVSSNEFYINLFAVFAILFGAIGAAMLITILIIFFKKNLFK
ncbi:MAG: hypothetical protein AABX88_00680 [Nanoarchaeota archaeon]